MGHAMFWRANDVVVGVVTGVVVAIVSASLEAIFVAVRFLSFGDHSGGLGGKLPVIALVGAIVGGLVGFALGALIKPREKSS